MRSPGAVMLGLAVLLLMPGAWARYNTSASRVEGKLNVHIIAHSHDDAGWLKTFYQYYWGANNSIQVAGVQYILDTVVQALQANPDRKFVYADMSFFMLWWSHQDEDTREAVAQLVARGQLDFVNGGYVQHDEAASHYVAMIDQTTRGHRFLAKTFGKVPRVGWQIDPFGHSSTQAALLSAHVGFDALFFGRADYQDMAYRKGIRALEMVWRGSESLEDADIWTGNFASGNYGPPAGGFNWDWGSWTGAPVMDDPRLETYNVPERVETFVRACQEIANVTRGNDIMAHMGSDFHYANAHATYKNIDKLVHYLNQDGRINAFYSTPARYVAAKHAYNESWPLKADDFFPYADFPHAYWTGYFTSRPTSKGYIRAATSYLQAARQLEALAGVNKTGWSTDALEEAVSLLQHHDAITGTEKQHVANDYHKRLAAGMKEAQHVALAALERLMHAQPSPSAPAGNGVAPGSLLPGMGQEGQEVAVESSRRRLQATLDASDAALGLQACDWLNVSACHASVELSKRGEGLMVVAYNPLAWGRVAAVRVPLAGEGAWRVTGPQEQEVPSQVMPVAGSTRCLQQALAAANATCPASLAARELVFLAELPPTGFNAYYLQPVPPSAAGASSVVEPARVSGEEAWPSAMHGSPLPQPSGADVGRPQQAQQWEECGAGAETTNLGNGVITLQFECKTGALLSLEASGVRAGLTTRFAWYNSSDGLDSEENRGQASGAYIFRPNGEYDVGPAGSQPVGLEIVRGDVVSEARQVFSDWTTLITRLYAGQPFVEFEWTVGPIPHHDGLGREVVVRYATDLKSGSEFWTDANGREMIRRIRDQRPAWDVNITEPVAGNYYPITAAAYIQDGTRQLALLTERAQGAASLRSGELEVMLHRRTEKDDWRGVGEPLDETLCGCTGPGCDCTGLVARGVHWLMLAPSNAAAPQRRSLQQLLNDPPLLAFAPIPAGREGPAQDSAAPAGAGLLRTFSMGQHALPPNVHLLTLMETGEGSLLVRLAHLFQKGEDDGPGGLSQPATVDLNAVVSLFNYKQVTEVSLSANQKREDALRRLRFKAGERLGRDESSPAGTEVPQEATGGGEPAPAELARLRADAQLVDCRSGCRQGELRVTLGPMEVRSFELAF